jgi:hypothetical protein
MLKKTVKNSLKKSLCQNILIKEEKKTKKKKKDKIFI